MSTLEWVHHSRELRLLGLTKLSRSPDGCLSSSYCEGSGICILVVCSRTSATDVVAGHRSRDGR